MRGSGALAAPGGDWYYAGLAARKRIMSRKLTIAGGSTEIQKDLVARRMLGL